MKAIKDNQNNAQSGKKNAQLAHSSAPKEKKRSKFSKSHPGYWRQALTRTVSPNNTLSKTFSVQIQHLHQRHRFPLRLSGEEAAAKQAQAIYVYLLANGWDATLAKFKPEAKPVLKVPTVGEYIGAARAVSTARPRTFEGYATKFRTIVASIAGIQGDKSKNDYVGVLDKETGIRGLPGVKVWRAEVEAVKLSEITPDAVARWITAYIGEKGQTPETRRHATNTVRATIRNAASLFSEPIVQHLKHLNLPNPLPFEGLKLPRPSHKRFESLVSPATIYPKAVAELWNTPPEDSKREQFTIYLLALFGGLRRGEIDALQWSNVDFNTGDIHITATDAGDIKSDNSASPLTLAPEVLDFLKQKKIHAKSPFVIESTAAVTVPSISRQYRYRCDCHFKKLLAWLKANGWSGERKPLHAQRKEFGSYINEHYGLAAASDLLRHGNVNTTRTHYARPITSATFSPSDLVEPKKKASDSKSKLKILPKKRQSKGNTSAIKQPMDR